MMKSISSHSEASVEQELARLVQAIKQESWRIALLNTHIRDISVTLQELNLEHEELQQGQELAFPEES